MASLVSVCDAKCDENNDLQQHRANASSLEMATINSFDAVSIDNTEYSAVNTSDASFCNTDSNPITQQQSATDILQIADKSHSTPETSR